MTLAETRSTEVSEPEAFMAWLTTPSSEDGGDFKVALDMGNGMWAAIHPLMFHWTLKTGVIGDKVTYEDRWCYADGVRAACALEDWRRAGFEGEPKGWRRHPATGRRRNDDGDPASEWHAS